MRINQVKRTLRAGQVQLGTGFAQFRSPDVARILAAAGFKWAFLDTEHGGFDLETIQDICRVAVPAGLVPIVRVADLQYSLVARSLDAGAQGIIFPRVESRELLERAVSWTRFPPTGIRGFGLASLHVDFEKVSIAEIAAHMNEQVLVVLQIETALAVERRDELLSVPGVDAVMIGPVDLSISLGVPGDFMHPKVVEAMEKVRDSCLTHGVIPGTQTRTVELARFWRDHGMLLLGCNSEFGMLYERAVAITGELS
ncbi:MAG: aldolase [Bryobacterales bacterium]|nr:aldolase [Bryobacterales bacterium]